MEGFSNNHFSWKEHTLFVLFRDCHSVSEARGLNPGCGHAKQLRRCWSAAIRYPEGDAAAQVERLGNELRWIMLAVRG